MVHHKGKEHHGLGKGKEFVPGTKEYRERFGHGHSKLAKAHIPGTGKHHETEGGKRVDEMPWAEDEFRQHVPEPEPYQVTSGHDTSLLTKLKEKIPGTKPLHQHQSHF
ncbi:hypothetical protein WJX72_000147 [[Myrmecia] bisecta]|uniref:Uncharacterized protein n=1 Tax=[Myrmecia] bisecta TaxID=41462 RepID=A0AAW1R3C2_9CHLO